jgi:hypothetical protein
MTLTPEERFQLALGKHAVDELRSSGHPLFMDDGILAIGREAGIADHLVDHAGEKLLQQFLIVETSRGVFDASPLAVWYEENFEPEAWREANKLRRAVLKELAATYESGSPFATYQTDANPFGDTPLKDVLATVVTLKWQGYVHAHHLHPGMIIANIEAAGYDLVRDEAELARVFPTTSAEDADRHAPVVADVLSELITSCEQVLRERGWDNALQELERGDREYRDGKWVNAVGEYYAAVESTLKYRLAEASVPYAPTAALRDLASAAMRGALIPANYQHIFGFLDSIRSPRRHGQGPEPQKVDVGPAEALLMGNHARSLIVYLGHRPAA